MSAKQLLSNGGKEADFLISNKLLQNLKNPSSFFKPIIYKPSCNFAMDFIVKDFNKNNIFSFNDPYYTYPVEFYLLFESKEQLSKYELMELIKSVCVQVNGLEWINLDSFSYLTFLLIKNESINENYCLNENSEAVYKYSVKIPFCLGERLPLVSNVLGGGGILVKLLMKNNNTKSDDYGILHNLLKKTKLKKDSIKVRFGYDCVEFDTPERLLIFNLNPNEQGKVNLPSRLDEHLFENIYTIGTKTKSNDNNILDIKIDATLSHKYIVFYVHSKDHFDPTEFEMDPIINATLNFGNDNDIKQYDSTYIRVFDPKRKLGRELPLGMYMISFALHPDKIEPSGSINLSKIKFMSLQLTFPKNSPNYKVTVCGCNMNIAKTSNGRLVELSLDKTKENVN